MDLRSTISASLAGSFEELIAIIKRFAEQGGTRDHAYAVLQELRAEVVSEAAEDRIMELMDIVTGYCSPQQRIWSDDAPANAMRVSADNSCSNGIGRLHQAQDRRRALIEHHIRPRSSTLPTCTIDPSYNIPTI